MFNLRNLAIWGVIVLLLVGLYSVMNPMTKGGGQPVGEITYSELLQKGGRQRDQGARC